MPDINTPNAATKQLRVTVKSFLSEDGKIKTIPKRRVNAIALTGEQIEAERDLVILLTKTKYTNKHTKTYLSNSDMNYKDIAELDGEATESGVRSSVWYDMNKIRKELGGNIVSLIENYGEKDVQEAHTKITELLEKYTEKNEIVKRLLIDIPKEKAAFINEESFEQLLEIIRPYTAVAVKLAITELTKEQKGYFWYLVSNGNLVEGPDNERYEKLRDIVYG